MLDSGKQLNSLPTTPVASSRQVRFGLPIFIKVLFVIFIVSLIPISGMIYLTLRVQQTVRTNVHLRLDNHANELGAQVNNWLDLNLRVLRQAATHPDIVSMEEQKQLPFLISMENAYEWTYRVLTLDLDGFAVARSSGQPIYDEAGEPIFYRGDRTYFQDVIAGDSYSQQVLISRSTGKPALCLSVPIKTTDGNYLLGVLLECSFLELLSSAITNLRVGESGFAMLLNEKGQLIAHGGNPELVSEELQNYEAYPALSIPIGESSKLSVNGEELVALRQNVGLDWTLIIQQNAEEAFAPLRSVQRNAFLLYGFSAFLIILAAYLFTGRLVKPLERLTSNADSISRGQLEVINEELGRGDEIGELAKAIERLRISVKMMLAELGQIAPGDRNE